MVFSVLLGKINIYDYFHEHMSSIKGKGHPRTGHEDPEEVDI